MMKKGILINAETRTIGIVEYADFAGMKRVLDIQTAEQGNLGDARLHDHMTLWCDEEGRFVDGQHWFKFAGGLIAGSAILEFHKHKNFIYREPNANDVAMAKALVSFVDAEELDDDEKEPSMGFIGSATELETAIANGQVSESLRGFFA